MRAGLVAAVEGREADVAVAVTVAVAVGGAVTVAVRATHGPGAVVDQVDVAEVAVVVVVAVRVASVGGVARAGRARLHVRVAVRADDERVRVAVVEAVVAALACDDTRYDTIRDAILTCARKPTRVSLIYRTQPTTEKCKNRKTKSRKQICSEITVNSPGIHVVNI